MVEKVIKFIGDYNARNEAANDRYDFYTAELYAIMELSRKSNNTDIDLWQLINNALSYGFEIGYTTAEKDLSENR